MHDFFDTIELAFTTEILMQIFLIQLWLTHFDLVTLYNDIDLGQHSSGNGWQHQTIAWTNVDSSVSSVDIQFWGNFTNINH